MRARLTIGLVNNMPDGALQATERQFEGLLAAAAGPLDVELRLFSIAEVERGEHARAHMRGAYADAASLPAAGLDGLIVTGAEPRTAALEDEPYWASLARLIDWTQHAQIPTLWSCLAAHAAVLRLDGVGRQSLDAKLSGVFACQTVGDHPLLALAPAPPLVPHSRLNGLAEADLVAAGYEVLTRSDEVGVDAFVKPGAAPALFLQGHPEYAAEALQREYLRDVLRYLRGERPQHPAIPSGYFDVETELVLGALADAAHRRRDPALIGDYAAVVERSRPEAVWRPWAQGVYRNWLEAVRAYKASRAVALGAGVRKRAP
jgi:homoserine O-succinyltransferase